MDTHEYKEKVRVWQRKHWKGSPCPICKDSARKFTIGALIELVPYKKDSDQVHPVVPIMCTHCGYTFLMNAVIMGIVSEEND